jgi:hypothetical protein
VQQTDYKERAGQHVDPDSPDYRNALFHQLVAETSCYRYWGQGIWPEYGREICRRGLEILEHVRQARE